MKLKEGMHDLKHDEYHAINAMSKSQLDILAKSPSHFKYWSTHERETKALLFGGALHALVLEPEKFDAENVIWNGRKAGKKFDAFKESAGDRVIFKPDEVDTMLAMQESIDSNKTASGILKDSLIEKSIFWQEEAFNDLWCKCKPDIIRPDLGILGDLKTCRDAAPGVFMKDIANFHYHWQAFWYLRGIRYCGAFPDTEFHTFVFVCVEKTPPYPVASYMVTIDDDMHDIARQEVKDLLTVHKQCTESGKWEAYPDELQEIYLPKWYK